MSTTKFAPSAQQAVIFDAFENGKGHFAVVARAGTGKSTTCRHGIALAPELEKVYLAFNKKNVKEMEAKMDDPTCQVMSLNGLGHRYVLRNWKGVRPDDEVEGDRIKAVCDNSAEFRQFTYKPFAIVKEIVAFAKNTKPFATWDDLRGIAEARRLEPDGYLLREGWTQKLCVDVAFKVMEASKVRDPKSRISFNDQLWLPVVMGWATGWFDLVVVDECQDMNATQLILAQKACRDGGRIILVGDPRQAIYAFRGADVTGMDRLIKELDCKTYPLTVTYRCPKTVVAEAQKLVPDFEAGETAPEGTISTIRGLKVLDNAKVGDAIISRYNAPLMNLCLNFLKMGIRAYIEGRDIARTLLAIHKGIRAGSAAEYLANLDKWANDKVMKMTGDDDATEQARALVLDQAATLRAVAGECGSGAEIESKLYALFADSESAPPPSVVLSSVHKAKGMEWNNTFLLTDTFGRCTWTPAVSEENNIAYVAVTRAIKTLTWVTDIGAPKRKNTK